METQYYTVVEKQDFFEIIENKYGELAIFIGNFFLEALWHIDRRYTLELAAADARPCH